LASLNPNTSEQDLLGSLSADTIDLSSSSFGMPEDALSSTVGQAEKQAVLDTLTPEAKKPDDSQKLDEQMANISINLKKKKLFLGNLSDIQDDDAGSDTDALKGVNKASSIYNTDALKATLDPYKTNAQESPFKEIDISGKTEEEVQKEEEEQRSLTGAMATPDVGALYDAAKPYAVEAYGNVREYFNELFEPKGLDTEGVYNVASGTYTQAVPTGLGTSTSQSAIGLSQPPPASLAGAQAGDINNITGLATAGASAFANIGLSVAAGTATGLATTTSMGAAGSVGMQTGLSSQAMSASSKSALKFAGQAASVYGIYSGIKEKDYFSAGLNLMVLLNPATAVPAAIMMGAKMLLGAWMSSKRQKPKFGGAEFKATKNGLEATGGWGYNGYKKEAGQATVASVSDYVNSYTKAFGLNFNGNKWAKAIEADPRMNRYDNTNESGYADPSILTRKIFETKGLITGNPTYNGQAITSQADYVKKAAEFNAYYKKTALENGGLVDAKRAGITQDLSNEYKQITFKNSTQVGGGGTGKNYQTKVTGGYGTQATTETGYYEPGVGRQPGRWVPAASNVVLESAGYNSGTGAYAINYNYEDATPFDMVYRNLVGRFNRGQGGTNY